MDETGQCNRNIGFQDKGVGKNQPETELMVRIPNVRYSFSLKTLLFIVTLVAVSVYLVRSDRSARLRTGITAKLTTDGCTVLLGCQAPPGTAPETANQEVVYVSLGSGVYSFQDVLKTNYFPNATRAYGRFSRYDPDAVDLSQLPRLNELRVLDLSDRQLTDEDLSHIGRLPFLEVLLTDNAQGVTNKGLTHISGLTHLRFLSLPHSQITDEGVQNLADLVNLERLNLHGAPLKGPGLRHLQKMAKLRRIDLGKTRLDDAGLANFRSARFLEELILNNTNVTDEGLRHLQSLQKLSSIDVSRTGVTFAATEAFQANSAKRIWITR